MLCVSSTEIDWEHGRGAIKPPDITLERQK